MGSDRRLHIFSARKHWWRRRKSIYRYYVNTMLISRIFTLFDTGVYIKTVSENLIETHRKYLRQYADICKD